MLSAVRRDLSLDKQSRLHHYVFWPLKRTSKACLLESLSAPSTLQPLPNHQERALFDASEVRTTPSRKSRSKNIAGLRARGRMDGDNGEVIDLQKQDCGGQYANLTHSLIRAAMRGN